jgi:hypothetical protein
MVDQRLKGQEVSIRVVNAGNVVAEIDSVSNFNDSTALEIKEDGFLGEVVNRFDEILNGFGGDLEIHLTKANWIALQQSIIDRAQRLTPEVVFNVVRTDLYPNGDSIIFTYADVHWGDQGTSIGSRGDFVKVKLNFKCSERPYKVNALP